jgi:hypothetical protein
MVTKLPLLRRIRSLSILSASLLLASCGAGTAAILSNAGDSSGSAPPTLTAFQVENPKVSPADLHFESSESVTAELFFAHDGGSEQPMMALTGPNVNGNQVELPPGTSDRHLELRGRAGHGLRPRRRPLRAPSQRRADRRRQPEPRDRQRSARGAARRPDAPPTRRTPAESSGNVEVRIGVSDSSSDVVTITVKWRHASDAPDAWQLATASGVFPEGIETTPDGVELSFHWNTNVDLGRRRRRCPAAA